MEGIMIEIKNASFKYKEEAKESIKGINLTIKKGEVVLLCGESGCGKSTLTRVINGLIPQFFTGDFTGQVLIDGQSINDAPLYETAKKVGSVFQNPRTQFFTVNTTSELAFGCENQGMPEQEILKRIDRITGDMKLESLLNRNIFGLSGGEKQKIACGSIAVSNPDIMVLDEPSSNLDFEAIEDLKRSLLMWKQQGKTIIIAEHRLYFLMEMADRILYMKNGVLEHEFAPEQLRKLKKEELEDMGLRVKVNN
jgi:energy-coupling factor transporter ATP-binding protein EcfA2